MMRLSAFYTNYKGQGQVGAVKGRSGINEGEEEWGASFSAASVASLRVVSGLANVKRDLWQMKTMLMRIPVDVANEVAAAIQLSQCRGIGGGF